MPSTHGNPLTVYGDGSQAYDFVAVQDCAQANVLAMKGETTDAFYNVGTGIRTSIKELAELLLNQSGANTEIRYEPGGLTFVKNRIGCPEKAAREIGFKAEISLEQGLQELMHWRESHKSAVEERRKKDRAE